MESMRGLYSSMTKKVELVGTEEEQASLLGAAPQFRNGAGVTFTRGGGGGGLSVPSLGMPQVGAAAAAAAAVARGYSDRPDPAEAESEAAEADPESLLGRAKAAASVVRSAGSAAAEVAATAGKSAKVAAGLEEAPPKTRLEEMTACCPAMSRKTRLMGFMLCYGIGSFFWLLSTPAIPLIFVAPAKFAVPYTLGSLISMGSTMFMVGPTKQLQNMCKEDRRLTTTIYLSSMIGTLAFAMIGGLVGTVLCLVCISAQMASMVWYVASYVPGGQTMVKAFFNRCIACCPSCISTCWQCCSACCCRG
jgi:hypothetical protein